jgi:hypothetical protein
MSVFTKNQKELIENIVSLMLFINEPKMKEGLKNKILKHAVELAEKDYEQNIQTQR